jgi:hypothetical protein
MSTISIRAENGVERPSISYYKTSPLTISGLGAKISPAGYNLEVSKYKLSGGYAPAATAQNVIQPHISGMIASYDGASFSSNVWSDNTGSYDTNASRGTVSISSSTLNGYPILEGSTADGLRFPIGVLPSTFTFFHVTRYNGTEKRIFDGVGSNWLDGFWDGNAGVAYHDGWITSQTDHHGTNWVLSTSQNSLYRSNGITRGSSGGGTSKQLSLNHGAFAGGEASDWQCAEVIVFNRHLNSTEYGKVEQYLSYKYGIDLNGTVATSLPYSLIAGQRETGIVTLPNNYTGYAQDIRTYNRDRTTIVSSKPVRSTRILANSIRASVNVTGQVNTKLSDGSVVSGGGGGGGGGGGSDSAVASTIKQIWY